MNKNYLLDNTEEIDPQTTTVINEFLKSFKLANRSEGTIDKYKRILKNFFLSCNKPLNELKPDDVQKWLQNVYGNKKPSTQSLQLSVLSSFFRFCNVEEYIDKVLIKSRWRPRLAKSIPKYLDVSETARAMLSAEKLSLRDRALIAFLLSSGCRRSEVSALSIEDIDLENRTAYVTGKGNKSRQVHFNEECALLIEKYLKTRQGVSDALFLNKFGQRLGPSGIYRVTIKLGQKAGFPRKLNPHICRHTFATHFLARGAELEFISSELGHTDLNATRIYARVLPEQVIALYKKIME